MIFIVLGGLKIWPLLGVFHFVTHFLRWPPYILNCRQAKTKRSWDLTSAEFLSFNDIYKYT